MIYTPGDTYALMVCAFLVGAVFGWRRRGLSDRKLRTPQ